MPHLRDQIQSLATDFATAVTKAVTGASFSDIAALSSGPSGNSARSASSPKAAPKRKRGRPAKTTAAKAASAAALAAAGPASKNSGSKPGKAPKKPLMRRGPEEIAKIVAKIVDVVAKKAGGMRAEDIGKALGMKSNELPRPLKEALDAKKLTKRGVKRATTYSVAKK